MTPLVDLVQTTTLDLTPNHLRLPPVVWAGFIALNKVHGLWRWYRSFEMYQQPDNLFQLLAGHIANKVLGESHILRLAAQCLLVATRLLECVQQQYELCQAGRCLLLAIKGHYPAPLRVEWEKNCDRSTWLSPTTVHWWKYKASEISQRIQRIALCTLELVKEAFVLSMKIMDVIDAFSWSPAARKAGVIESFVNITKWLDAIVDNKAELLAGMTENRGLIEHLLRKSPFTYESLHEGVAQALAKTEMVSQGVKKISAKQREALIHFGKKAVSGTLVVAGFSDYRPVALTTAKF